MTGSNRSRSKEKSGKGLMGGLTDQVGAVTYNYFNNRDMHTLTKDPLGNWTRYFYDDAGRLKGIRDRNTSANAYYDTITYNYTPSDKIDNVTYGSSGTVVKIKYTYDNLDRLKNMQDTITGVGTSSPMASYDYYPTGNLKTMNDSNGFQMIFEYDGNGNLTSLTYPGSNKVVTYTYDKLNRLKTVTINWLSSQKTATYDDYDAMGRLPGFTNFNGTRTTYGYDNANRLKSISNQAGTNVISSYIYTLDGNGNRTNIVQNEPYAPTTGAGNVTYTYNTQGNRLNAAGSTTYTYDNEGQLASNSANTYTFDDEHRLKTNGTAQFYYDGNGNRLIASSSGVATKYIYDPWGRLLAERGLRWWRR